MTTRTLYLYDSASKEYVSTIQQSEDPNSPGTFFGVDNSTEIAPLFITPNTILTFTGTGWIVEPDFRGQIWYEIDGTEVTITDKGPPRVGLSQTMPAAAAFSKAKTAKIAMLSTACMTEILNGFNSSALGVATKYPCSPLDQTSVNHVAITGGSLWCSTLSGEWAFVSHTAEQAQQVQKDMIASIQTSQIKYAGLVKIVNGALDIGAVATINW